MFNRHYFTSKPKKPDMVVRIHNVFRQNCMDVLSEMQAKIIYNLQDLENDLFTATLLEKKTLEESQNEILQGHIKKEIANQLIGKARLALNKSFYEAVENIKNIEIE